MPMPLTVRARRLLHVDAIPNRLSIAVGVLFLLAVVSVVAAGGIGGALCLVVTSTLVVFAARRAATDQDADFVVGLVVVAFFARALFAAGLDLVLTANGRGGALFLDDAGYVRLGAYIAQAWHDGTPIVGTDPSIDNNYVRLAATLFFAFGPNTMLLKIVNTSFGVGAAVMIYRTMMNLRLPGPRVGLLLVLFFPSLALWSALALKDAYVVFFAVAPVWLMAEYGRSRHLVITFALTVASLLAIYNVRAYIFVILVVVWPLAMSFIVGRRRWVAPTATAAALAAVLLATTPALTYINPNVVTAAEYVRRAMAQGARTGFVEPLPVIRGNAGDRFSVSVPGRTAVPIEERRTIVVHPGQDIAVEGTQGAATNGSTATVVRPGDIVVIATGPPTTAGRVATPTPPTASTPPGPTAEPVTLSAVGRNLVGTAPVPTVGGDDALTLPRGVLDAIQYLPRGILYVIGAPFPLAARSLQDAATIPEMIVWYVCEALAVCGLIALVRQRRFEYAYGVAALAGIGLVLSLF
ncbi:MAG TPA: hypothetical protein VGR59_07575, partial [Gemmatimonadaceae bacterium]|nr:hypothetical protein [Gemmatimonadaceae bacterium]